MPNSGYASEAAYLAILEGAAQGILIAEIETKKFIFANPTICNMFGYSKDEMLNMAVTDIHPKERLEEVIETFKAQARGDLDLAMAMPCQRKDGSSFNANINTTAVTLDGVECNVGFFSDDAQLQKATEALAKSKRDWESIFNGIPHPTIVMDADHNVLSGNRRFEELVGKSRAECKDVKCWQIFHNHDDVTPPPNCPFKEFDQSTTSASVEMPIEALGGFYIVSCTPMYDDQGKLEKIIHILTDITARKKAEDDLKSSEERYRDIVSNIDDCLYIHDFEGTIIDVNSAVCETMGYSREQLIGEKLSKFETPEQAKKIESRIKHLRREGTILFDGKQIKKSGEVIDVQISAKVVSDEGKGIVQGFARDLTDIRIMEESVRVSQKLESLGVLAGGIAHDFNNLLSGVFGCVDMARLVSSNPEVTQYLDMSLRSLGRARDLTRQLLTFSKGGSPVKQTDSLNEVIREATQFALHGSSVACDLRLPSDLWLCDYDRNQIHQVVENIVINAMQAMPVQGVLVVTGENIRLSTNHQHVLPDGKYIRLSFEDSGSGIPEASLKKIFDPFFTTKKSGTGLGLATSYSIIKRHGGHIEASSIEGQGSTLTVLLPASDENISEVPRSPSDSVMATQSGQVLLMDDEALIRESVGEMLKLIGYTVITAQDGDDAVRILKAEIEKGHPFCAIILDLTVPGGKGGMDVIEQIHELAPDTPAIVSSGYSQDPAVATPSSFGFSASIQKPFVTAELAELLNDLKK